ncbi:MAG: hypothetical protein ACT4P4_13395 [Betaproteobacteria bacterium]
MKLLLQRVIAIVLALGLAAVGLIFASVLLAVMMAAVLSVGGWLWWRTRHLRHEAARAASEAPASGAVLEGEYRVEREVRRLDERPPA